MSRQLFVATLGGLVCILGLSRPTVAHAILVEARPAVDSTAVGSDVDVRLHFNVRIDRSRSRLTLVLPDGQTRSLTILAEGTPDVLSAQATDLTPGAYRLRWQVLAVDGHLTRGTIPFHVSGP